MDKYVFNSLSPTVLNEGGQGKHLITKNHKAPTFGGIVHTTTPCMPIPIYEHFKRTNRVPEMFIDLNILPQLYTEVSEKTRAPFIIPWLFKDLAKGRNKANCDHALMLVYDIDAVEDEETGEVINSIEEETLRECLKGTLALIHETASSTFYARHWRIIVPLAKAVPAKDFEGFYINAATDLGILGYIDKAGATKSQGFFLRGADCVPIVLQGQTYHVAEGMTTAQVWAALLERHDGLIVPEGYREDCLSKAVLSLMNGWATKERDEQALVAKARTFAEAHIDLSVSAPPSFLKPSRLHDLAVSAISYAEEHTKPALVIEHKESKEGTVTPSFTGSLADKLDPESKEALLSLVQTYVLSNADGAFIDTRTGDKVKMKTLENGLGGRKVLIPNGDKPKSISLFKLAVENNLFTIVDKTEFLPSVEPELFVNKANGVRVLNTFALPNIYPYPPKDFVVRQEHREFYDAVWNMLEEILTPAVETLKDSLAQAVLYPERRPLASLIISGKKRTGKSFFATTLTRFIFGDALVGTAKGTDFFRSKFTSPEFGKLFLTFDEYVPQRGEEYNFAKRRITENFTTCESKGVDAKQAHTYARYRFTANPDAMSRFQTEADESRFFIIRVQPQRDVSDQDKALMGRIEAMANAPVRSDYAYAFMLLLREHGLAKGLKPDCMDDARFADDPFVRKASVSIGKTAPAAFANVALRCLLAIRREIGAELWLSETAKIPMSIFNMQADLFNNLPSTLPHERISGESRKSTNLLVQFSSLNPVVKSLRKGAKFADLNALRLANASSVISCLVFPDYTYAKLYNALEILKEGGSLMELSEATEVEDYVNSVESLLTDEPLNVNKEQE